jgi:acyl carrier protein
MHGLHPTGPLMNDQLFDEVAKVLVDTFGVDPAVVNREATLQSLGLDSLALMEFVFAVEDRFSIRIPEDRLDPRQAGLTLARLVGALAEQLAPASSTPAEAT